MHFVPRHVLLAASLIAVGVEAQIPPQPGRNPNATPPGIRPGMPRPGVPTPARPAGPAGKTTPAANGEPKASPRPEDAMTANGNVKLEYRNTELSIILLLYEDLTGLKVIRDANAEQATVSVDTTGELPKEKAVMFIEKSLLLNGYAFVPAGEGMVKLLAFDAKKPQTEGARFFESAQELPLTDEVVSFVALLKYLNGEDAIKALDQVIPRHSYGVLVAVPNARALVIVENSNTIRAMLTVLDRLDNKPTVTSQKTFQLVRSDAEDVKKALDEILGTDEKKSGGSSSGGTSPSRPVPQIQNAQGGAVPAASSSISYSDNSTNDTAPKIIAIPRRNSLLVIATPDSMEYIGKLIEELDAASELRNFVSRTLNYLGVDAAMGIISDAISRGEDDGAGGSGTDSGVNSLGSQNSSTSNQNRTSNSSLGSSMFGNNSQNSGFGSTGYGSNGGAGGMSGFGSSSGSGASANLQPLREDSGPRSIVVGKTLLISDPTANSIFASGPPEHLRVLNEIIDELDVRPQQILISVVIGELNLDHSKGLSVNTILRGALTRTNNSSAVAGGLGGEGAGPTLLDPRAVRNLVGDVAAGGFGNALAGGGLTLYAGLADGVDAVIKTLESNNNFRVLSRPTIFTMNNRAATITSGVSIPVATSTQGLLTGGANNSTGLISNVQYQPVVLSLQILPLINSEDELTLQISQENNEASEARTEISGNSYPELSQQTLNTTVLVKNRATVLLGGLIRESKNKSKSGLPFVSRIPFLGALAGSQGSTTTRRELLVFIQPRIVHGMTDLPPTVEDAPGTSAFGSEVQNLLVQEKEILSEAPTSKRRVDVGRLFRKLFNKDQPALVDDPVPSARTSPVQPSVRALRGQ